MPEPSNGVPGQHDATWVFAPQERTWYPVNEQPMPPSSIPTGPPHFGDHVRPATDAAAAEWVRLALADPSGRVGDLVPSGYESYLFVDDVSGDVEDWSAAERHHAAAIGDVAARFTNAPEHGYFAVWDGHGYDEAGLAGIPRLELPSRSYYLLVGEVRAVTEIAEPGWLGRWRWRQPDLWWPEDRAWFIATDVDLACNYVAGTARFTTACAAAVDTETHLVERSDCFEKGDWLDEAD